MINEKDKYELLKAARQKKTHRYRGNNMRIITDLPFDLLKTRKEWNGIFKVLTDKYFQPRVHYPAKLSFRPQGGIELFQTSKKFATTKPILQELMKSCS